MTEQQAARPRRRCVVIVLCLFAVLNLFILNCVAVIIFRGCSEKEYSTIEEHFKYGSVGSDTLRQGFPYWIWKVLPVMFQDLLPPKGKPGYEAFGLIVERDHNGNPLEDRPVGFSKRHIGFRSLGMAMVGLNCAFCHSSTLRRSNRPDDKPEVILGMPANTVDVEDFLVFLFKTAKDPRFTSDEVMRAIEKQRKVELQHEYAPMGFIRKTVYQRVVVPLYRWEIGKLERKFCFIKKLEAQACETTKLATDAGPGRIDLWATYKVMRFATWTRLGDLLPDLTPGMFDSIDLDIGQAPGFADAAPLWQLEKRMGRGFHWDGNTLLLNDYTIIAALGLNVIPRSLDVAGFDRIARWARTQPPPRYDKYAQVNGVLSAKGEQLYFQKCASCHDAEGRKFGLVEPVELIGTDRNRFDAFTEALADKLRRVGTNHDWRLRNFGKTNGYSNLPLDGIWLRAPYLHNGSVPTLRDLLDDAEMRPKAFCRGNDEYDWDKVGFKSDLVGGSCGTLFRYDTNQKGNSNTGHEYGTDLKPGDKDALIEYLKTL